MSSLQIGKAIYNILAENNITKVFPLIVDKDTTYPFVVYKRSGLEPANTKDRYNFSEIATLDILIAANDYDNSIILAEKIKTIMEHSRGTYAGITIVDITLEDADEDYIEDAFIQKLIFKIEIK